MTEPPPPLAGALAALAAEGGIGLVLDLGAGEAPALEACLAAGAAHVALVEPNPALHHRLAQRLADRPQISLHPLAVAGRAGVAPLQVFNLAPLSSLRAPTGLRALFPGLRRTAAPEVTTCDPAGLLARLPPPGEAPDLLVIDTPGEEATVIEGLAAAGALDRFGLVLLRCGTGEDYAGSLPAAALCHRLEDLGWRCRAADAAEDPDRPWFTFRPDPRAQALARLQAEQAGEAARRQALEASLAAARKRIEALETALGKARAAATAAELRTAEAAAEAAAAAHAAAQAGAAVATAEGRAGALEAAATATDTALAAARSRIAELEAAVVSARAIADEARTARDQARDQARAAVADETQQLRGDAATALRLQAQREADLQDLRQRHARLATEKERQDALLATLTDRLTLAAQYLQQLEADTGSTSGTTTQALLVPPAATGGKRKKAKKAQGKAARKAQR